MNEGKTIIPCKCKDCEHIAFLHYDEEDIYLDIYVNHMLTFWKRLKYAVKFIFGYKSDYVKVNEYQISSIG